MQNEFLQIMDLHVLRKAATNIGERKFIIMVDETTDASCTEHCVIVIRWVDSQLEFHEEFIGFYAIATANADTIVTIIKEALLRMHLTLQACRGECYDGAATMKGDRNGVAAQILPEEPRALYIHCYGHALNLACQDMAWEIKQVRDALDVVFKLSKLLKYSAKRTAEYQRLKQDIAPEQPGFCTLCPTRWTVRASSLTSVLRNYHVLQECLESFTNFAKSDLKMSAQCIGVKAQLTTLIFCSVLLLARLERLAFGRQPE